MSYIPIESDEDDTFVIGQRAINNVINVDSDDDVQLYTGTSSDSHSSSSSSSYSSSSNSNSDINSSDEEDTLISSNLVQSLSITQQTTSIHPISSTITEIKQKLPKTKKINRFSPINPNLVYNSLFSLSNSPQSILPTNATIQESYSTRKAILTYPSLPTDSSLFISAFSTLRTTHIQNIHALITSNTTHDPNNSTFELYLLELTLYSKLQLLLSTLSTTSTETIQFFIQLIFTSHPATYQRFSTEHLNHPPNLILLKAIQYQSINCFLALSILIYNGHLCPTHIDIPILFIDQCSTIVKSHFSPSVSASISSSLTNQKDDTETDSKKIDDYLHEYVQRPEIFGCLTSQLHFSTPTIPFNFTSSSPQPTSHSEGYSIDLPLLLGAHFITFYGIIYPHHSIPYKLSSSRIISTILWYFSSQPALYSFSTHHPSKYSEQRSHLSSNCLQPLTIKSTQDCSLLRQYQANPLTTPFPSFIFASSTSSSSSSSLSSKSTPKSSKDNPSLSSEQVTSFPSLLFLASLTLPSIKSNYPNDTFLPSQQYCFEQGLLEQFSSYAISIPSPPTPPLNKPKLHPFVYSEHILQAQIQLNAQNQTQGEENNINNRTDNGNGDNDATADTTVTKHEEKQFELMHTFPLVEQSTLFYDQPLLQCGSGRKVTNIPKDHTNYVKYFPRNHWLISSLISHSKQYNTNPCLPLSATAPLTTTSSSLQLKGQPQSQQLQPSQLQQQTLPSSDNTILSIKDDPTSMIPIIPTIPPSVQINPPQTYPTPELVNPKRVIYSYDQAQLAFTLLDQSSSTTLLHSPFDVDLYSTLLQHNNSYQQEQQQEQQKEVQQVEQKAQQPLPLPSSSLSLFDLTISLIFPSPLTSLLTTCHQMTSHLFDFVHAATIYATHHNQPVEFWTVDGYNITPLHLCQLIHPLQMYQTTSGALLYANSRLIKLATNSKSKSAVKLVRNQPTDEQSSDFDRVISRLNEWEKFRGQRAQRWVHQLNSTLELFVFAHFTSSLQRKLTRKYYNIAMQHVTLTQRDNETSTPSISSISSISSQYCELMYHLLQHDNRVLAPYLKVVTMIHKTISKKFILNPTSSTTTSTTDVSSLVKAIYHQIYYSSPSVSSLPLSLHDYSLNQTISISAHYTTPIIDFISTMLQPPSPPLQQHQLSLSMHHLSILRYLTLTSSHFTQAQIPYCISYLLRELTTSVSSLITVTTIPTTDPAQKLETILIFLQGITTFLNILLQPLKSFSPLTTTTTSTIKPFVDYIVQLEQTYSAQFNYIIDTILHISSLPEISQDNLNHVINSSPELDLTTTLIITLQFWKQQVLMTKQTPQSSSPLSHTLYLASHLLLFYSLLNVDQNSVIYTLIPQSPSRTTLFSSSPHTHSQINFTPSQTPELTANTSYHAMIHQLYHRYKLLSPSHPLIAELELPDKLPPVSLMAAQFVIPTSNTQSFITNSYLYNIVQWISTELTPLSSFLFPLSSSVSSATPFALSIPHTIILATIHTLATLQHTTIISLAQLIKDQATKIVAMEWVTDPTNQSENDFDSTLVNQSLEIALIDIQSTYSTPPGLVHSTYSLHSLLTNTIPFPHTNPISYPFIDDSSPSSMHQFTNKYSGPFALCSILLNLPTTYANAISSFIAKQNILLQLDSNVTLLFHQFFVGSFLSVIPTLFFPVCTPDYIQNIISSTTNTPSGSINMSMDDSIPSSNTNTNTSTNTALIADLNPFAAFITSIRASTRYYHSTITTPLFEKCIKYQSQCDALNTKDTTNVPFKQDGEHLARSFILSLFMSLDELTTPQYVYFSQFNTPLNVLLTKPGDQTHILHPNLYFAPDPKISSIISHTITSTMSHHRMIDTPGLCASVHVPETGSRKYIPLRPLIQEVDKYVTRYHFLCLLLQIITAMDCAHSFPSPLYTTPEISTQTTSASPITNTAQFIPSLFFHHLQLQLPHIAQFSNTYLSAQYTIDMNTPFKSHWQTHTAIIINAAMTPAKKELLNTKQRIKFLEELLVQNQNYHKTRRYQTELNKLYDHLQALQKNDNTNRNPNINNALTLSNNIKRPPIEQQQICHNTLTTSIDNDMTSNIASDSTNPIDSRIKSSHRQAILSTASSLPDSSANQLVSLTNPSSALPSKPQPQPQPQPRGYPVAVNFLPIFTPDHVTTILNHQQNQYQSVSTATDTTTDTMNDITVTGDSMNDSDPVATQTSPTFHPDLTQPIHQQIAEYCQHSIAASFSSYGQVMKVILPTNHTTNLPRGACTVLFVTEESAQAALTAHKLQIIYSFPPVTISTKVKIEQSQLPKYQHQRPPRDTTLNHDHNHDNHDDQQHRQHAHYDNRSHKFGTKEFKHFHQHDRNNNDKHNNDRHNNDKHNNDRNNNDRNNNDKHNDKNDKPHQRDNNRDTRRGNNRNYNRDTPHERNNDINQPHQNKKQPTDDYYYRTMVSQRQKQSQDLPAEQQPTQAQTDSSMASAKKTAEDKRKTRLAILGLPDTK